jgi:UDP-N-acetylmuramate--alanine ligase
MEIYCSGIGGIGLSAYAALQKSRGHTVAGSDRSTSAITAGLQVMGIDVHTVQDGSALGGNTDLFVYSEAIPEHAAERVRAQELGIPSRSYFQALGEMFAGGPLVAVCGTHGKSTTTAMVARVLIDAGMDPTVVVGTKVPELGGKNWRNGQGPYAVVEACEYRRSFLALAPTIVLMTTVDGDHFDVFRSVCEYQDAFVEFLGRLPQSGVVITHGSDPDCRSITERSARTVIDADCHSLPKLCVPGVHMQQNAQLVCALGEHLRIPQERVLRSLEAFSGTWRRMELKGTMVSGALVIDDYAHHPVEIRATLRALREAHPQRRIWCVFQPHTFDRTRRLYHQFMQAFSDADIVIVPNIYVAREEAQGEEFNLPQFVLDIAKGSGTTAREGDGLERTKKLLLKEVMADDLVVCMGAGDITSLAGELLMEPSYSVR